MLTTNILQMTFEQNETTKKFVAQVKSIVNTGKAGTVKEIAAKLEYNYSALNQIINGGRNVPDHVYRKFTEVYEPVEVNHQGNDIIKIALFNQAYVRVILRAMAELLSKQREESVTKTLGDLEAAVRAELQSSGR